MKKDVHARLTKMCRSFFSVIQCARRSFHSYLNETKKNQLSIDII